ncbi:MAG: DUF3793 family protein [Lachnospiraceae bacterium]
MSQETWEILCEMEADDVELQLALQCAPLITGLKISNLLTISPEGFTQVGRIVEGSVLSLYPLLETEEKMVILLYLGRPAGKVSENAAGTETAAGGRVRIRSTGGYFAGILRSL